MPRTMNREAYFNVPRGDAWYSGEPRSLYSVTRGANPDYERAASQGDGRYRKCSMRCSESLD